MQKKKKILIVTSIFTYILVILTGCNTLSPKKETTQKLSSSETVFETALPESISESDEVFLEIVDDVTGVGLNPARYRMQQKDEKNVFVRVPLINGSLVKYRYVLRSGNDLIECNSSGSQVIYRMYYVQHPEVVKDSVQSWSKGDNVNSHGELSGYIFDEKTDLPISDIILSINGNTTVSGADGYYEFNNIPTGNFLITAIHPSGIYEPFQQGAVIAKNALTPASFGMEAAEMVDVSFEITVPENTIKGAPVRIIGNTFETGNLFSELSGASSIIPSRAPTLSNDGKQTYHITLSLPSGLDFRYKYTLGNGFINSERSVSGEFLTRQFIVPNKNSKLKNNVYSWSKDESINPIHLTISAPINTPLEDTLSIQFNPFSWMPSIPMWKISDYQWTYTLYGPFEYLDNAQFRFCRNDRCGYADDALTAGSQTGGFVLDIDELGQKRTISYQIDDWVGQEKTDFMVQPENYRYSKTTFIKGLNLPEVYNPYWLPYLERGMIDAAVSGVEYLGLSPSWSLQNTNDGSSSVIPGKTYSTIEINQIINYAQQANLEIVLFPLPDQVGLTNSEYWSLIDTSYDGWIEWYSDYSRMIKNYAYLSQKLQLKFMIIGGSNISPALPDGKFPDGTSSSIPYEMIDYWKNLISEIREIYTGQILFALPDTITSQDSYSFLHDVDAVMLITDSALSEENPQNYEEFSSHVEEILDKSLYTIYQTYNKPIVLGLNYSAIDGSATNCSNFGTNCGSLLQSDQLVPADIDIDEQGFIYNAFYSQSLSRDWIVGIFSMEYDPSVIVRDSGISTRGKPAFDVITYYNNHVIQK